MKSQKSLQYPEPSTIIVRFLVVDFMDNFPASNGDKYAYFLQIYIV